MVGIEQSKVGLKNALLLVNSFSRIKNNQGLIWELAKIPGPLEKVTHLDFAALLKEMADYSPEEMAELDAIHDQTLELVDKEVQAKWMSVQDRVHKVLGFASRVVQWAKAEYPDLLAFAKEGEALLQDMLGMFKSA